LRGCHNIVEEIDRSPNPDVTASEHDFTRKSPLTGQGAPRRAQLEKLLADAFIHPTSQSAALPA
jgi:hypothetical protein